MSGPNVLLRINLKEFGTLVIALDVDEDQPVRQLLHTASQARLKAAGDDRLSALDSIEIREARR